MHEKAGLNDRIHSRMLASGRSWTAEEMGREFLKLSGGAATPLVRALLRADVRFTEQSSGTWSALSDEAVPLRSRKFALAWVETGGRDQPQTWRLHLRPHGAAGPAAPIGGTMLLPSDPLAWDHAFRVLDDRRLVTLQAGALARMRQWMGRRWALGGDEESVLDLTGLTRLALIQEGVSAAESAAAARLPQLFSRWRLGPVREEPEGVPLPALELLLEHLLERFGDLIEADVTRLVEETLASRPVPCDRFRFTLRDLDSIPEGSGIYRFLGEGDDLLYVGKAVSLRRRLASYFRPLPPELTKREDFLRAIRRYEYTTLPSELEALLRESRAIRENRPPWNVQVEVHELDSLPPAWWWPLVFLAPGADPQLASAIVVTGPSHGFLFRVQRDPGTGLDTALISWLDRTIAPAEEPAGEAAVPAGTEPDPGAGQRAGVLPLDAAEVRLAVRFYLRERDRLDRVDAVELTDGAALAEALHRMAAEPRSDA